jgi:hypothetical protein
MTTVHVWVDNKISDRTWTERAKLFKPIDQWIEENIFYTVVYSYIYQYKVGVYLEPEDATICKLKFGL